MKSTTPLKYTLHYFHYYENKFCITLFEGCQSQHHHQKNTLIRVGPLSRYGDGSKWNEYAYSPALMLVEFNMNVKQIVFSPILAEKYIGNSNIWKIQSVTKFVFL